MLLGVAGGCSAISKQGPVPLIAERALLRRMRTTELANRVPSLLRSSLKPTCREPRCAPRSDDTNGTSLSESLYIAKSYVEFRSGRMRRSQ